MANLTITVDDATLKRARVRAIQRNESVNAYLAEMLRRYAGEDDTSATQRILALAQASPAGARDTQRTWTRDELHRG